MYDFDKNLWIQSGYALTTPARTAYHIIKSAKYYIKDSFPIIYKSGKKSELKRNELENHDLPSKEDIIFMIKSPG